MMDDFLRDAQQTVNLEINIKQQPVLSCFSQKIVGFGSCFAQNLQAVLNSYGFSFFFARDICAHYSAESIANALEWVSMRKDHSKDEFYYYLDDVGGFSPYRFFFKKRFFGTQGEAIALARMKELDELCFQAIRECSIIVITLGTARIIRKDSNDILINAAAGMPSTEWSTEMLSVDDNIRHLERALRAIQRIRPRNQPAIFLTISPQRYLFSDGIPECRDVSPFLDNMLGKSILRVAVDEFVKKHKDEAIYYFPAYEIVIDELRQYETLSTYDYVHIEQQLTPKFVVKRFLQAYCTDKMLKMLAWTERFTELVGECTKLIDGGLRTDDDVIIRKTDAFFNAFKMAAQGIFLPFTISFDMICFVLEQQRPEKAIEYFKALDIHPTSKSKIAEVLVELERLDEAGDLCHEIMAMSERREWDIPNTRDRCQRIMESIQK